MPRGKTNTDLSNLSLVIPRRVHRQAKAKWLRSGAPSFASYVAMVLSRAPERADAMGILEAAILEHEILELRQHGRS